jgi:hypothetical protein
VRELDVDYIRAHLQHAYAITGHGMQGGTIQAATVVGQPGDFSRNWSYTALSRAREPIQVLVIDEPTRTQQEREEIAPAPEPVGDPLARMRRRMRERDDEDLALEQLHRAREPRHAAVQPARAQDRAPEQSVVADQRLGSLDREPARHLSHRRRELYDLDARFAEINTQLGADEIRDAKAAERIARTIAVLEAEQQRGRSPRGWRDRGAHEIRTRQRERQLTELQTQQADLLRHVPDPQRILDHARQLTDERHELMARKQKLHEHAVAEELAARPQWLQQTLGPEPNDHHLRQRWEKTAREIAGYRITHRIEDPELAFGAHAGHGPSNRAAMRAIKDTRLALGLDAESHGHGFDAGP